jgi:hypothetical protein
MFVALVSHSLFVVSLFDFVYYSSFGIDRTNVTCEADVHNFVEGLIHKQVLNTWLMVLSTQNR